MEFIQLTELSENELKAIMELWNREYPEKLNFQSLAELEFYLESKTEKFHIIIINEDGNIQGWYFDFFRDNEKWFALILDAKLQGKGFGTKILNLAKEKETELNGWVIDHNNEVKKNGGRYDSPLDFYLKNGFKVITDCRLELENISAVKIKWSK